MIPRLNNKTANTLDRFSNIIFSTARRVPVPRKKCDVAKISSRASLAVQRTCRSVLEVVDRYSLRRNRALTLVKKRRQQQQLLLPRVDSRPIMVGQASGGRGRGDVHRDRLHIGAAHVPG